MLSRRCFITATSAFALHAATPFAWPKDRRLAISLSFDDARLSQIDTGLRLLETLDLKATFYLSLPSMKKRLEGWKEIARQGHEIGNHSTAHACTGNYRFTRALEDFNLEEMARDLDNANREIEENVGVKPVSFAYPCGQKFVGRGKAARSYIPLVAERFESGRGYLDEMPNYPQICDLAQLMGTGFDGTDWPTVQGLIDKGAKNGSWIVFAGHEIGKSAHQTTDSDMLKRLADYAKNPANGIWVDTVGRIGKYVAKTRS